MVDGSARDPKWDHDVIREELRAHDPALLEKPILVVFNKLDLAAGREAWPAFERTMRSERIPVISISAETGEGLDDLRTAVGLLLPDAGTLAEPQESTEVVVHRLEAAGDGFTIEREGDAFRVRGKRIERLMAQTSFENEESAERFQRDLVKTGVDAALRKAGIQPGDLVRIGADELEWEPAEVGA